MQWVVCLSVWVQSSVLSCQAVPRGGQAVPRGGLSVWVQSPVPGACSRPRGKSPSRTMDPRIGASKLRPSWGTGARRC